MKILGYHDPNFLAQILDDKAGSVIVFAGNAPATGKLYLGTFADTPVWIIPNNLKTWSFETNGDLKEDATNGGNILFQNGSKSVLDTVASNLSATGSTQNTSLLLTSTINHIGSVTPGLQDGVMLPPGASTGSKEVWVVNRSSSTAKIYPQLGSTIDGNSPNIPVTLAANLLAVFKSISGTQYFQMNNAIGGGGGSQNFSENEVPSGTIDGVNAVFSLANTPQSNTTKLYLNGVRQKSGIGNDYTISGNTITFGTAPFIDAILLADYIY
jgi:hypothetical protein